MAYEIDFLAVGEGSKSGDAIALRFGNLAVRDQTTVVIIDGGTQASGEALVAHVRDVYGTTVVDLVVSTHPDNDHVLGLHVVLERLQIRQLAMHRPWAHANQVLWTFADRRLTDRTLSEKLRRSIEAAHDLEALAFRKGIPIVEPFAGAVLRVPWGELLVLGPAQDYYEGLLCAFRQTPNPSSLIAAAFGARGSPGGMSMPWAPQPAPSSPILAALLGTSVGPVGRTLPWAYETLDVTTETLADDIQTSAENNSSVILLLTVDGRDVLFTADAGISALERATHFATQVGHDLSRSRLALLQVPHHGSRRNLGPTLLNRLPATNAVISAGPTGAPKHPASRVVNALIRRGVQVHATQGKSLRYAYGIGARPGWYGTATALGFSPLVEL